MSRIGRLPIPVPAGVDVMIEPDRVIVKGPRGQLAAPIHSGITVARDNGHITVTRVNDTPYYRSLHGLSRTLVANMVTGVTTGFRKTLEITGVGYRATKQGDKLVMQLGYSHPVEISPPEGITFEVETPTRIAVSGIDKALVGEMAARVRATRGPEPYKGKGVRYSDERIRRKAGKAGKTGAKK